MMNGAEGASHEGMRLTMPIMAMRRATMGLMESCMIAVGYSSMGRGVWVVGGGEFEM